mgnify:CR=1 FL=1
MLKIIKDFKVELKADLITVYRNGEIVKGVATNGSMGEADFNNMCEQVQRHVDKDKKSPWYIDAYLGHNVVPKLTEDKNTIQNTTDRVELDKAIKKQKKFIKGKLDK